MEHPPEARKERIAGLDGLRGLAVAGVLAFHTDASWARGGFLGVSLFFTLSGFLICGLLLEEHERTGTIALRRFWARRARRLLPASLVALLGVLAYGAFVGAASDLASLRADVVAAQAYVANWRFVASSQSYADLFRAPSAAQHFWSLAIEEQFYIAFPIVVLAAAAIGRRHGRVRFAVGAALSVLLVASLAAAVLVGPVEGGDPSRSYYGTDVRAAELLVGAGLAVVGTRRRWMRWSSTLAPVALAALLWSWHAVDRGDGRLYGGGLLLHAIVVAVLIAAAHGSSWTARALGAAPLRGLGRISYAAYLYHWPVFLWLSPARLGVGGWTSSGVRLAVTFALAVVSTRWLEEPVRARRRLRAPRHAGTAAAAGGALVLAAALVLAGVTTNAPRTPTSSAVDLAAPPATTTPTTTPPAASLDTLPVSSSSSTTAPLRVYVVGDSVALRLGLHLQTWGVGDGRLRVWAGGWLACAAARGGSYRYAGVVKRMEERCNQWPTIRARELDDIDPDVVVVSYGVFDVLDRRLPGSSRWQHVGEPAYDDYVRTELATLQALLQSRGARVVWLASPYIQTGGDETGRRPPHPFPEWDHARMDRFNDLVRETAAASPGASVIDLRQHPVSQPDGIHPSVEGADELAAWLAPQLLDSTDADGRES